MRHFWFSPLSQATKCPDQRGKEKKLSEKLPRGWKTFYVEWQRKRNIMTDRRKRGPWLWRATQIQIHKRQDKVKAAVPHPEHHFPTPRQQLYVGPKSYTNIIINVCPAIRCCVRSLHAQPRETEETPTFSSNLAWGVAFPAIHPPLGAPNRWVYI